MIGSFLLQAAVFLAAAAIAAPLARALKMGSVLGYLAAGILIGPFGLGFVYEVYQVDSILHIAELGVVFLLFLIGLELRPARLWGLRKSIVGAGGGQFVITSVVLAVILLLAPGFSLAQAIVLGCAFALSSTAFVLQMLEEKGELTHRHGRLAFSILLLQDLAAVPLLAVVPLLTPGQASLSSAALLGVLKAIVIIGGIIVLGRWGLNWLYRLVARSGVREAMTASALLTVVGVSLLMQAAGLSAALGAFLAGALLADSEYRHQIQADIQPFGGLLLGLFFTAIGMSLNLNLLLQDLSLILALVAGLMVVKGCVLFGIGRWQGLDNRAARRLTLAASQGGEFAFVVLTLAVGSQFIDKVLADRLAVVVTLSMVATPLLLALDELLLQKRQPSKPQYDVLPQEESHVVIAGFGRFGQVVARILHAKRLPFTALDVSPNQVALVKRFGDDAYFGDAARLDILRAAKIDKASAFVLAIDDVETSIKTAALVRRHFPDLPIYARARNRQHFHRLMDQGVEMIRRETFLSAVALSEDMLSGLGVSSQDVRHVVDTFATQDRAQLISSHKHAGDTEKLLSHARAAALELEEILNADEQRLKETDEGA